MSSNNKTPLNCVTNNADTTNGRKSIAPRSWAKIKYFTKQENNMYICNKCFKEVKTYNNSSKQLIDHLKDEHHITKDSEPDVIKESAKKRRLDFDDDDEDSNNTKHVLLDTINDENKDSSNNENQNDEQKSEKINSKKKDLINQKLVAFIIKNNLSFNLVESEEFQDFIEAIRPGYYKLPCRQTLRNSLLPKLVNF